MPHPQDAREAPDDVYTMAEAARLKGVSYHTVSRAVRAGRLPVRRLGRMALVAAPDLAVWRPMIERAPKKYRRRHPDSGAVPALVDLASGDRAVLAQRFAILSEAIHVAALDRPLDDFLALLCARLAEGLALARVALWGIDRPAGVMRRLATFGPPLSAAPSELRLDGLAWFGAPAEQTGATVRDAAAFAAAPMPLDGLTSIFVSPLRLGGETLGVLTGDRAGTPFALDADQLAFSEALANQAALAVEIARLRARLAAQHAPDT